MLKKHGMPLGYRGFERPQNDKSALAQLRKDRISSAVLEPTRVLLTRAADWLRSA
jgi:hypothetical protein